MPHLKKGSTIINTTSVTPIAAVPNLLDYSATKGAILAFTRSLAKKLAEKGIRVNGSRPRTDLDAADPVHFPGRESCRIRSRYADETSWAAERSRARFLFLACEDSSYITGTVLHPNGGDATES